MGIVNNLTVYIMTKLQILNSDKELKKYKAIFIKQNEKTKTIHFGANGYEDYTQHHDEKRRDLYRKRHAKDLETNNPMKPGYLSYYILLYKSCI